MAEEIIAAHPDVAECAVIGASDKLKGEVPLALVLLKTGTTRPHQETAADFIAAVRERIGPFAGASHRQSLLHQRLQLRPTRLLDSQGVPVTHRVVVAVVRNQPRAVRILDQMAQFVEQNQRSRSACAGRKTADI